jgi:hypothetical protein
VATPRASSATVAVRSRARVGAAEMVLHISKHLHRRLLWRIDLQHGVRLRLNRLAGLTEVKVVAHRAFLSCSNDWILAASVASHTDVSGGRFVNGNF